jgi:hypothetical protein
MSREGDRIVDAARARGITLRLIGGLAVREHCAELTFCDRDYSDLDMAGQRGQLKAIVGLFAYLGYAENTYVRLSTGGRQLQFTRPCVHTEAGWGRAVHPDDHVDVFLDTVKMDHEIDLGGRFELADDHTLPSTDLLLTKLQIHTMNEKDLRDILTLLKDVPVREGLARATDGDAIDASHIAAECAADWGLYYDVVASLKRARAALERYELTAEERSRVGVAIDRLSRAIDEAPKSRAWRRRARVGTRKPWYNVVEDQGGE